MRFKQIKITLHVLVMLALPVICFGKEDTQAVFEKGNAYYSKAKYNEAITAYQQVLEGGYQSVPVYFNLGNASYKNGDIANALFYYEKAHLLSPGDDDINFNIRLANSKITDKIEETPEFFVTKWWNGFVLSFSANALATISILGILLASAALILYFFSYAVLIKKVAFYTSIVLFIAGIFISLLAYSQVSYFNNHKQAIIFASTVDIKGGPGQQQATLFVLHEGTKINLLDTNNGWTKFKLANGHEGWIKLTDIKEI